MSQFNFPVQISGCQICGKQALFQCGQCQNAFYCSRDHQFQHWKEGHKDVCMINKQQTDDIMKKILQIRKSYYQNFSHKQFSQCLLDAKVLVGLQRKRLQNGIGDELDYGGTVCLLTKTYLLMNDKKSGRQELQAYLRQKKQMLQDLREIPTSKSDNQIKQKSYDILQKKLNLISCLGNLSYAMGMDCIGYYVLYTKIIITFFGAESHETSNCYFLIGCYFAEQGYFKKAIQCFKKSAALRGNFAGDCFYNIGILYKLQGELPKALQTLQIAQKFRMQQYGQDSAKVAQIFEMTGIIYTELNDFKTAFNQYQQAYKLRVGEPQSAQFNNLLDLIEELYGKLSLFIDIGQPKVKKTEIYKDLQSKIKGQKQYWKKSDNINKNEQQQKINIKKVEILKKEQQQNKQKQKAKKFQYNLVLSQEFTSKLGLAELFRLSQLQLQLEKCTSQFSVIYTIGTSAFYENLSPDRYAQLEIQNKALFEMIKLQQLKKIKNKQS